MTPAQANHVRIFLQQRKRFTSKAEPVIYKALQAQIAPLFHTGNLHPHGTDVQHLIHPDPLTKAFKAIYTDVAYHFGKATHQALAPKKSLFKRLKGMVTKDEGEEDFEDGMDAAIDEFLRTVSASMIAKITETTRESVRDFITNAIENGTGAASLATELRKNFDDFNRMRSLRIARTEVGRASNFAGHAASQLLGIELSKTWLHAGNSKNDRPEHEAASGQTVGNDDPFDIDSGYAPMFPQDGTGGADEEVNCNCVVYRTRVSGEEDSEAV